MFSPCQFHAYVSIGTLESDLLSQSTPVHLHKHVDIDPQGTHSSL